MKKWVRHRNNSLVDLSGLMDIIFILLIFVMLSVSFQKKFTVMELDLPASESSTDSEEVSLEIALSADSKIYINRIEIPLSELMKELDKAKPTTIRLNAEKKVSFEHFISVSEILKTAGIEKIDLGLKLKNDN